MNSTDQIVNNIFGNLYGYRDGIKNNQLQFIAQYGIARVLNIFDETGILRLPKSMKNREVFDHTHLFQTVAGQYVLVTSPYPGKDDPASYGLTKIYPLYSESAETYLKLFDSKADLKKYFRE